MKRGIKDISLLEKIKNNLFYTGIDKNAFKQIQNEVAAANLKALRYRSVLVSVFWIYCLCMSFFARDYEMCRPAYIISLCSCAFSFLCSQFIIPRFPKTLPLFKFIFRLSLLGGGIGIAVCQWNLRSLTLFAVALISPSVFIPLAEETGLIVPIGRWVLYTAINTLKTWQAKYNFRGIISVNVSPIQLLGDGFIEELLDMIETFKVDPSLLEIEITEGVMINNMGDAIEKLRQIKALGCRVSLDDFGTGYSSLSYLQMLPLNTLKIDKAFINDITSEDGVQATITRSIIDMVEKMGLETIAEGVENNEQLNMLNQFRCNFVQGFLRGKPMPYNLCDAYLAGDVNALLKN